MTAPRVVSMDGGWLELQGHYSTRELGIVLVTSCDCCEHCEGSYGGDLDLSRDQVVELRDQLDRWLALGQL